jgi:hypothetical protein
VVLRNRVNGNLQCTESRPRPVGGFNVVGGNKEDQCRGLWSEKSHRSLIFVRSQVILHLDH